MFTLITGGCKNGKSHIAEEIICSSDLPKIYIATMEPYGEEAHLAIERHRKIRNGKGFETIEKYTDVNDIAFTQKSAVLLECACNLLANEMFSAGCQNPVDKIIDGVKNLVENNAAELVIVTNQVGSDGIDYSAETMKYIEKMGIFNQRLASEADCVIEAVWGIPVILKGEKPSCL